jgi:hypothetical protein
MIGYLDKLFGAEEYKENKNRLLAQKQDLSERLTASVTNHATRFEPAISFVLELKAAKKVVSDGNREQQRDFFKKVGSNFQLVNRTLRFVPRKAWKTVVDSGHFPQPPPAPPLGGAGPLGETVLNSNVAERMRFELRGHCSLR